MSSFSHPRSTSGNLFALLADGAVDFQCTPLSLAYSYSLTTKPGGSSASMSGSKVTPDVVGTYTVTVTAGVETLAITLYVMSASAYAGLVPTSGPAYSDAEKRSICQALAGQYWASGWAGTSIPANLQPYGGR